MKVLITLFAILCLLVSGSENPWFPWLNLLTTGVFMLICNIEIKKYYTRNNNS